MNKASKELPRARHSVYLMVLLFSIFLLSIRDGKVLAAPPPQALSGFDILAKAEGAAGGKEQLAEIENFTIETQTKIYGSQTVTELTVIETVELPDKTKQVMKLPGGVRVQVLNGKDSWKQIGADVGALSPLERREMQRGLFRDPIILLQNYERLDINVSRLDDMILAGETLHVVRVRSSSGDFFDLLIDAKSGLIKRKRYHGAAEAGLARLEEVYSDFRTIDGIQIPHHTEVFADGRKFIESHVSRVQFNSKLGSEFFFNE